MTAVMFPWEDLEASRKNRGLQLRHFNSEMKKEISAYEIACPQCGRVRDDLAIFYFKKPTQNVGKPLWASRLDDSL